MLHTESHQILVSCFLAISVGVILLAIAKKINIPGIVLLLVGGFALGPSGLALVNPEALGSGLTVIASISIGIILFEGGLTLDFKGYTEASSVIKRLLSVGVLTTWILSSLAVYFIFQASLSISFVCGSLIIVTGPTVIGPLLRRIKVTDKLNNILHWEGVLIDPIGVFVAVLCFEWIITHSGPMVLTNFLLRLVFGLVIGVIGGILIYELNKRKLIPYDLVNIFALGFAVLIFGLTECLLAEAGLLSVTVAGFVLGIKKPEGLDRIKQFKAEITDLLIGTLFILLSARLSVEQFNNFGLKGILVVAIVMLVIRPISIFLCTWKLDMNFKEKLFLSWIAPRGIVAASMASLFTLSLSDKIEFPNGDPRFIETFVYSIIAGTIILQGFTASALAKVLGLHDPNDRGWLIIGAHEFARKIALFITKNSNLPVVLIDTKASSVLKAKKEGLKAFDIDARKPDSELMESIREINSIGYFLALTDNENLNAKLCKEWSLHLGVKKVYRWISKESKKLKENNQADDNKQILISINSEKQKVDFEKKKNESDITLYKI